MDHQTVVFTGSHLYSFIPPRDGGQVLKVFVGAIRLNAIPFFKIEILAMAPNKCYNAEHYPESWNSYHMSEKHNPSVQPV
jgi:hypothetical protein